ncbi:hypothetical protein BK742_23060 [Bacillus thuringiensis serovar pingluonsis]|uniref:BclA C-terminal domain-containing protein n=2 Tax=Bacillus TaxID=1386 RepID=A0A243B4M4_BACTU|nr:hypothetical protein BK742_23060 [Bacillus thuringiensis serovar pingluonsis]
MMENRKGLKHNEIINARAFDPNLVGPTLPPIPSFTLPAGPTGATGTLSTASASVVTNTTQTVASLVAIQFTAPVLVLDNVIFNGTDTFTIVVPGNYYCIGALMPAETQTGPFAVGIGLNGIPTPALDGVNYAQSAGQEVVGFGFTGQIPASTTISLFNLSGHTISIGGVISGATNVAARLTFFRIS